MVGALRLVMTTTQLPVFSEGGRIIHEAAAAAAASACHRAEVTMATGCRETAEREAGVSGPSAFEHRERLAQSKILKPCTTCSFMTGIDVGWVGGGGCVGGVCKSSGDAQSFSGEDPAK